MVQPPHIDEPTVLDRLFDLLLTADGEALSVMSVSRSLGVPDSVLGSAVRALTREGVISTSGASKRHRGLPAMLRVTGEVAHRRRAMAAYRMRKAVPKRQATVHGPAPSATLAAQALPAPQPAPKPPKPRKPRKKPAPRKVVRPPMVTPPESIDEDAGRAMFRAVLDATGRKQAGSRAACIAMALSTGEAVSTIELMRLHAGDRKSFAKTLSRMVEGGMVRRVGPGNVHHWQLTAEGFAAVPAASGYLDAPNVELTERMTRVLRLLHRRGTLTAVEAMRKLDLTHSDVWEPLTGLIAACAIQEADDDNDDSGNIDSPRPRTQRPYEPTAIGWALMARV
jgi:hypothetical protein